MNQKKELLNTLIYKRILSVFLFCIASFVLFSFTNQASAQASNIKWLNYPDSQGFAYIQYTGEKEISSQELLTLIENQGCTLRVLWIKEQRIGYHTEAIGRADFVNQRFNDSTIQTNTKITLQCTEYKETKEKTEQTQSFNLNETHIHWITDPQPDIQRNKQGQATIQYGGGSFYQLVSRLSTQGCNVHTLSIYNQEKKQTYTYSFENTNEQNQEFTNNYKQHIPKDTNITITCVDNCTIIYGLDLVEDENLRRVIRSNVEKGCKDKSFSEEEIEVIASIRGTKMESYSECGDHWLEDSLYFFSLVPVFQDVCKIEFFFEEPNSVGSAYPGTRISWGVVYQPSVPSVVLYKSKDPSQERPDIQLLQTELHELCHVHQEWYVFKEYIDYDYMKNASIDSPLIWLWYETPMAQEFNEITGFRQDNNGKWILSEQELKKYDHMIVNVDGTLSSTWVGNPLELSAELCSYYILRHIAPNSPYEKYTKDPYITPQIEQWIEKYIVLPE